MKTQRLLVVLTVINLGLLVFLLAQTRVHIGVQLRNKARDTYRKLRDSNFYGDVYEGMFRISDETRKIFETKNINMEEQHKKLHEAAGVLLNFRPTDDPNPVSRHAASHHALDLQLEHFTAFRDAFLAALSKQKPKPDRYAVDAWRAILDAERAGKDRSGWSAADDMRLDFTLAEVLLFAWVPSVLSWRRPAAPLPRLLAPT